MHSGKIQNFASIFSIVEQNYIHHGYRNLQYEQYLSWLPLQCCFYANLNSQERPPLKSYISHSPKYIKVHIQSSYTKSIYRIKSIQSLSHIPQRDLTRPRDKTLRGRSPSKEVTILQWLVGIATLVVEL